MLFSNQSKLTTWLLIILCGLTGSIAIAAGDYLMGSIWALLAFAHVVAFGRETKDLSPPRKILSTAIVLVALGIAIVIVVKKFF
jgi:hypothetical protein